MWLRRRDPRIRDEIQFHRDRLIEDYLASGMTRADAERRAFLEFGNLPPLEESVRDARGRWLEDLARDLRYAYRSLKRTPGFAAIAVLSLALGIGANAAIFTLINAVMLRTLPVEEPQRLVQLTRVMPNGRPGLVSYPLFEYFRDNVRSISAAFGQWSTDDSIAVDGQEDVVRKDLVSGDYYTVLRIQPAGGRLLIPGDEAHSSPTPAVISDRYWRRRFNRDPSAIGRTFTIRSAVYTIVGVTPAGFDGVKPGDPADITIPLTMNEGQRRSVGFNTLILIARLKPGATVEHANAEVQALWPAFLQRQADQAPANERADILAQRAEALLAADGFNVFRYTYSQSLVILMGIVGLVLLLTCVNLSGLLLARGAARQREISIRLAIGAGRSRLVRQFLTESLMLAAIGGGVGLVFANWFSRALFAIFADGRNVSLSIAPDWRVVTFTAAVSLMACIAAGLVPALQTVRVNVNPALKEVRAPGYRRLGKTFVAAQFAISMILIVGATLFVGTLVKLYGVERGFNSDGLLVVNIRQSTGFTNARAETLRQMFLERLRALPGVSSASAGQILPIAGGLWTRSVEVDGYTFRQGESDWVAFNVIAPAYFATLGTALASGREFDDRDTSASPKVAIVNESFARYFFGNDSALGRRVTSGGVTYEIVGVARDAKYQNLRADVMTTMYTCWTQRETDYPGGYSYVARVESGDPLRLAPPVERLVRDVDRGLHVRNVQTYATLVDRSIVTERIMGALAGVFGVLALIIAGLGIFGTLAFQLARRTHELGVRMALGADRSAIVRLVLQDVAWMVLGGVTVGAAAAFMLAGLAQRLLFGLTPTDPGAFIVAAAILATAAALAGWLPVHRASHADPLVALRHE